MRALVALVVLAGCDRSGASGRVLLTGSEPLAVTRCEPGSKFGIDDALVFYGAVVDPPRGQHVAHLVIRTGAQATIMFTPADADADAVILDPHTQCTKFDIDGNHARFDCDAQAGRTLTGALEFGSCK